MSVVDPGFDLRRGVELLGREKNIKSVDG